jgi:hypothetical protein
MTSMHLQPQARLQSPIPGYEPGNLIGLFAMLDANVREDRDLVLDQAELVIQPGDFRTAFLLPSYNGGAAQQYALIGLCGCHGGDSATMRERAL